MTLPIILTSPSAITSLAPAKSILELPLIFFKTPASPIVSSSQPVSSSVMSILRASTMLPGGINLKSDDLSNLLGVILFIAIST